MCPRGGNRLSFAVGLFAEPTDDGPKRAVSTGGGGMMNGLGSAMPFANTTDDHLCRTVADRHDGAGRVGRHGSEDDDGWDRPNGRAHDALRSIPSSVESGQITFLTLNRGWRTHELVILPLASGAAAGQRIPGPNGKVTETGSLGEASTPCGAGAGSGIPAGSASCGQRSHFPPVTTNSSLAVTCPTTTPTACTSSSTYPLRWPRSSSRAGLRSAASSVRY